MSEKVAPDDANTSIDSSGTYAAYMRAISSSARRHARSMCNAERSTAPGGYDNNIAMSSALGVTLRSDRTAPRTRAARTRLAGSLGNLWTVRAPRRLAAEKIPPTAAADEDDDDDDKLFEEDDES